MNRWIWLGIYYPILSSRLFAPAVLPSPPWHGMAWSTGPSQVLRWSTGSATTRLSIEMAHFSAHGLQARRSWTSPCFLRRGRRLSYIAVRDPEPASDRTESQEMRSVAHFAPHFFSLSHPLALSSLLRPHHHLHPPCDSQNTPTRALSLGIRISSHYRSRSFVRSVRRLSC